MDRGAWWTIVNGVARVRHDLATKPPPDNTKYPKTVGKWIFDAGQSVYNHIRASLGKTLLGTYEWVDVRSPNVPLPEGTADSVSRPIVSSLCSFPNPSSV